MHAPTPSPPPPLRFQPHGQAQVWFDGAFVRVSAEGPFNIEGIEEVSRSITALYAALPPGQRFITITEYRRSLLGPPEAWERLELHVRRMAEHGIPLVASVWCVGPEVEARSLMLPRLRALFERSGRVFEVFDTLPEAEAWARERLHA